jgi:hypothetical protein
LSYDESYVFEVDIEGMINVKGKKNFSKKKWMEIMSLNFVLRIEKMLSKESYCGLEWRCVVP